MRGIWKQSVLAISLLALAISSLTCTGAPEPEIGQTKETAEFTISPISVTPRWLFVGDHATARAKVTNKGNAGGTYTAVFEVDGQKAGEKEVYLPAGGDSIVSFPFTDESPGNKSLTIGDSKAIAGFDTGKPYTIQYDDYFGQDGTPWSLGDTWIAPEPTGQIVRFTAAAKPFRVNKIWIAAMASIIPGNETFTLNIWDINGKRLWTNDFPWKHFRGAGPVLVDFAVPNIVVDDDFFVEVVGHSPASRWGIAYADQDKFLGLAYDTSDYETRSSWSVQGQPRWGSTEASRNVNWCMRVEGEGGESQVLYYDDGYAETFNAATDYSFTNSFTAPSYPFDLRFIQIYGCRDVKDAAERVLSLNVIDKFTLKSIWENDIPWTEIPFCDNNRVSWTVIDTGGIQCPGDFFIEMTTNNTADAHVWLGCDTTSINRNSDMSIGGNIIQWLDWTKTDAGDVRTFTRDNTKWMIRAIGIPK